MKMNIMKAAALGGALAMTATASYAADQDAYQLSSHILDISTGKPAPDVNVRLMQQQINGSWKLLDTQKTGANGRIGEFLPNEGNIDNDGTYKLIFETTPYFRNQGLESFYPYVEVNFNVKGDNHYHVPITLSPYGYSTYRGS
ncbi:5-hydroxyisourate hydrolase [Psychrobacter sp. PL15]|uniref:hydroxyisourate hydrolase n=1 Tax=unclassified Psychrobacter TaxID=196806 RepID=UPI001AEB307D|nr:hydroxyisourate hydrolase [Psychrobacter sp. PL15]MEC5209880.1 5-hydroxyisourate hydrolase [Psychrobacter sp. PL15]